jgi:hypothetical protein
MSATRLGDIIELLSDLDFTLDSHKPSGAVLRDPDGNPFGFADLGPWVQVSQHLLARHDFEQPSVHLAIAETGMRVNARPLGGCRLAIDADGLCVLYDIDPDVEVDTIARALWHMVAIGQALVPVFDALAGGGDLPSEEQINDALTLDDGEEPGWLN